jgi:hypothetical protein
MNKTLWQGFLGERLSLGMMDMADGSLLLLYTISSAKVPWL